MILRKIYFKLNNIIKFLFRLFIYYFVDRHIDILKYIDMPFVKNIKTQVNGKFFNILDSEYWNYMWNIWQESKKFGKDYYNDIPHLCEKIGVKNILEIGCGPGYLIEKFNNIDILQYTACDISENAVKIARKKTNSIRFLIKKGNIIDYLKDIDNYDCIIGVDILEHLPDKILNEVILKINTNLIINFIFVTPYINFVPAPSHIQYFSILKIKKLFSNHIIKFKPYSNYKEIMFKNF